MHDDITVISTDNVIEPTAAQTLYDGRKKVVESLRSKSPSDVTIFVLAYGRLEKTKQCIESILEHTNDVDYTLVLYDNGSDDNGETLSYFKSIPYSKKYIYRVTKNIHFTSYLFCTLPWYGKYYVNVSNDIIVTHNWLKNLITLMESDDRIGMVCPVSSNISNLQQVDLKFNSIEEMQALAAKFNHSDPQKWSERLRLMNPISIFRVEALLAFGGKLPNDYGFFHDFGDDDISFQIRRAGYRLMLAGDTWVHHNHDIWNQGDKDPEEFQKSLEIGRQNFMEKYQGVDAWEDVNNYWLDITPHIPEPKQKGKKRILGIDTKCGTPILDVKNRLRNFGIFDTELYAFTQSAKYVVDLRTICDGIVACDREEFLADQFLPNYFDYIVVDRPLNRYHEPQKIINDLMHLLKPGGLLMLSLLNTFSFREFLYCLGRTDLYNREFAYHIPLEALQSALKVFGTVLFSSPRYANMNQNSQEYLFSILPSDLSLEQKKVQLQRLLVDRYMVVVEKKKD